MFYCHEFCINLFLQEYRLSSSILSAAIMTDSPSVASRPTESELDLQLAELVNWQRFATHLPHLTRGDIEQIEQDNRDVQRQKLELFGTWLRRCPNASWNDIVIALEKARENTLVDVLKMKLNIAVSSDSFVSSVTEVHSQVQPCCNQEVYLSSEETIVEELKKLHRSFTTLAKDVRCKVGELVKSGTQSVYDIAAFIQEARVCGIQGLTAVKTNDELFDAILPHNDYLDCELLEMIVEEYLDDDDITKVKAHIDKVKLFKHTTPIKALKNKLQQYTSVPNISDKHLIVTIKLQADWGRLTLEFIEKLVQNLLQYEHKVRILKVDSGSISIMLLLPKEKLHHFIVSSSQKLQFMRLTGIFRLQIGDITVFEERENKNFSFESAFLESSQCGDNEAVQFLLGLGVNVNFSNSEGQTALILASESGQEEVVEMLLSAGANIHHLDKYGQTALMVSKANKIFLLLLQPNADIKILKHDGLTQLMIASDVGHLAVVDSLLRLNNNLNVQTKSGWSAIMFASSNGHLQVVELLLEKNADPNVCTNSGCTALMFTSYNGYHQVVEILLKKGANPNIQANDGWTALLSASQCGHHQVVEVLLKNGADPNIQAIDGLTSLIIASGNDHLEVVALLLKACADPNMYYNDGLTALMFASENDCLHIAELLLKENADPNAHDNEGWTPLMYASQKGHVNIAESLLKENADPNAHDNEGWTPLMYASQKGHVNIAESLLKENADPNVRSNTGWTALLLASRNGYSNVVVMLLLYKANPHVEICKHFDSFTIAAFKGNTDVVNTFLNHFKIKYESLSMGWYYACQFGHVPIIKLLSNRVDIDSDQTDLIISCAEGDLGTVVDQLMSGTIMPDVQFIHGITPLIISSSCGYADIVEALIQSGANVNKADVFGDTALDYAEHAKQDSTRVLLLQHGGLCGTDLDSRVRTPEESILKTLDDILTEKDICNLQSSRNSRRQRSLNISSIKRYLEESIDTRFSKHQSVDFTDNPLTIDLNNLNCD